MAVYQMAHSQLAHRYRRQASSHILIFICPGHWREPRIRSSVFKYFTHSPTDPEATLRITQRAVQLMLLAAPGSARAQGISRKPLQ